MNSSKELNTRALRYPLLNVIQDYLTLSQRDDEFIRKALDIHTSDLKISATRIGDIMLKEVKEGKFNIDKLKSTYKEVEKYLFEVEKISLLKYLQARAHHL